MQPDQEWMSESDLIDTICGKFVPTRPVQIGKAYHSVLEDPDRYLVPGGFTCDQFGFDLEAVQPMLNLIDRRGVFEVKTTREVLPGVIVVAKADHLIGTRIDEFKTTLSSFAAEKYLDSIQWRMMALLFEASAVTYHVATLDDHENGVVSLKGVDSLTVYPYPALEEDCQALLREFVGYVVAKKLDGILRARQEASSWAA